MESGEKALLKEPLPMKNDEGETEKMNQQLFPPVKIRKRKVKWCAKKVARHLASEEVCDKNEVMCDFSSHTTSLSYFGFAQPKFGANADTSTSASAPQIWGRSSHKIILRILCATSKFGVCEGTKASTSARSHTKFRFCRSEPTPNLVRTLPK
jgi:hypothetical protein